MDPIVSLIRIGPKSLIGRVFALQILFCRETKDLLLILITRFWRKLRSVCVKIFGVPLSRNPGVILAVLVGGITFIVRRAKSQSVQAKLDERRQFWSSKMATAPNYDEWAHAASMLHKPPDRKRDRELFDEDLVQLKLNYLRSRRLEGGVEDVLFFLRADLVRNLGNMCNPHLHKGRLQTPRVIEEYITEVRHQLHTVCETDSDEFSVDEKIAVLHEARHAFGRTALLLSGGAALGAFHLGVVRTLIEHRLLPRVVAGASVGSITCSFAATRTWSELESFFSDSMPDMRFFESLGSIIATAHRLLTKGSLHEIGALQRKMRQLIGDLTFQEAYDLSGRVLGISVCSPREHEPPRCLNYLTSPHVVVWSAVTASCAFPGLFEAQELMAKDRHGRLVPYHGPTVAATGLDELNNIKRQWRDGTLESDLPMMQLKELFNVNHFIVSQANPHIAPVLRFKDIIRQYGGDFAARLAHITEMEVKHRCSQALEMGFRLGGLAKLIAQDWEGDITIIMPATISQFIKIIQNPTPADLRKAVQQGRRCTWAKLSAIRANCGIELMLDECVADLSHRRKILREQRYMQASSRLSRSSTTKRIPSWNSLSHVGSWGCMDEEAMSDPVQAGGPWGGPSLHRLKSRSYNHNRESTSDSESSPEIESSNLSWTRVGGPLMKSASAIKLCLGREDSDYSEAEIITTQKMSSSSAKLQPGDPLGESEVVVSETIFTATRVCEYRELKRSNSTTTSDSESADASGAEEQRIQVDALSQTGTENSEDTGAVDREGFTVSSPRALLEAAAEDQQSPAKSADEFEVSSPASGDVGAEGERTQTDILSQTGSPNSVHFGQEGLRVSSARAVPPAADENQESVATSADGSEVSAPASGDGIQEK